MAKVKAKRDLNKGKATPSPWIKVVIVMTVLLAAWLVYLDAVIRDKFEGRRWQLPAQVYAQPLELYPGQTLAQPIYLWTGSVRLCTGHACPVARRVQRQWRVSIFMCVLSVSRMRAQKAGRYQLKFSGQTLSNIRQNQSEVDWLRLDPMRIAGIYPNSGEDRVLVSLRTYPKP